MYVIFALKKKAKLKYMSNLDTHRVKSELNDKLYTEKSLVLKSS